MALYDLDDRLPFPKYKGQLLEDVIDKDPAYVLWLLENVDSFECDKAVQDYIIKRAQGRNRD